MEVEVEFKLKKAWMVVIGVMAGVAAGYVLWGNGKGLEGLSDDLTRRGRRTMEAVRRRVS